MNRIWFLIAAAVFLISSPLAAEQSTKWTLTGGPVWEKRTGPGLTLALGGNTCTDDLCDSDLDVNLFGSFAGTFGFMYRVIPNLVVYGDINTAYINTNADWAPNLDNDKGFLFQLIVGAEFHVPFTGWLDAYLGLGFGYALLRAKADNTVTNWEQAISLRGIDFEMKVGADVYPFSRIPTLALGVLFRMGFATWPTICLWDGDDMRRCGDPDSLQVVGANDQWNAGTAIDETPFLIFIGINMRYTFGSSSSQAVSTNTAQ